MMSLPVWLPGPMFLLGVFPSRAGGRCPGGSLSRGLPPGGLYWGSPSRWGGLSPGGLSPGSPCPGGHCEGRLCPRGGVSIWGLCSKDFDICYLILINQDFELVCNLLLVWIVHYVVFQILVQPSARYQVHIDEYRIWRIRVVKRNISYVIDREKSLQNKESR